jgi:hypothetical protein
LPDVADDAAEEADDSTITGTAPDDDEEASE